ncbi:MAG: hypothetical protein ABSC42_03960 [Tepidisphaeraceae bacterium]
MGAWLQVHYNDFRCDPEDPPLWRYYLTLGTSASELRVQTSGLLWDGLLLDNNTSGAFFKSVFYFTSGNDPDAVIAAARIRMLILGAVLGMAIAAWAWKLGGPRAAIVAVAAFCFDPNFLAHSPLVKNDVPITLVLLLLMMAIWLVGRRATPLRWAAMSLAMGAAVTVKFSGVLAIPLMGLALTLRALLPEPWPFLKWVVQSRVRRLAVAGCLTVVSCAFSYFLIWACYRFRYGPSTDRSQLFDFGQLLRIASKHEAFDFYNKFSLPAEQLRRWTDHWKPGAIFPLLFWIGKHHLLPQTWIDGFLFTYGTAPGRAAFLLGESYMNGRWDYFPIAMAVKTPLATLVAFVIASVYWISHRGSSPQWWNVFSLLLLPILYLAVAMSSHLNLGIRHVLPVYPFLFIFLGITAAHGLRRFRRPATVLVSLLLLGLVCETYCAYPDYIPFFNIAAGGWQNGPRILGASNVDWGQDLPALAEWQRERPQYQLFLNYSGSAEPRYYGIHYVNLARSDAMEDESPVNSRPQVYAISAAAAQDPWLPQGDKDFYKKLESQTPIAVLGHCVYLYNPP